MSNSARLLRFTGFVIIILATFACRFASQAIATSISENGNPLQAGTSAQPATESGNSPTPAPAAPPAIPANATELHLKLVGDARPLPIKFFGANADPFIEQLTNDPRKIKAVKQTGPAVLRFPGGSLANYYDWRDGQLHLNPQSHSSSYYKFWVDLAAMIARAHPFIQRMIKWDEALAPTDWFQAVTVHPYLDPNRIAAEAGNPSRDQLLILLMGSSDQGIDRVLNHIAAKLPAKEIWVTEWSPRGGSPTNLNQPEKDLVTPDMQAHLIARTILAMLRHPEMTKALYFELYSGNSSVFQTYVLDNGQYQPTSFAVVFNGSIKPRTAVVRSSAWRM